MNNNPVKIWKAVIYIRISKENGEDTLENQKSIVTEHLNALGNINVCSIKVDDGYTGLNSIRPAFQELLSEIQQGRFDCIAVRDLSRLSRNYIEAGRYIQDVFPTLGIRFISVCEGFDFIKTPEYNIAMMVGFRNIVNEEYSHTLSQRVKSGLYQGYAEGKFLGAFAVYGYRKSLSDSHRLEPDPLTAKTVKDIFQWKLEGMSAVTISELLERSGIPSPAEHKKSSDFTTGFQKNERAKWSPVAVKRILTNRIYTGCLEQGKSTKPHLKTNRRNEKSRSEWICVGNTHEAIIPTAQFEAVSRLLLMDTRKIPGETVVSALAGFVRCKNCGQNMILKQENAKAKTYWYYVCCGKNDDKKACPAHRISKADLERQVFKQMRSHVDAVIEIGDKRPSFDISHIIETREQRLIIEHSRLSDELKLYQDFIKGLFDDFESKILSKSDFEYMRRQYIQKCDAVEDNIRALELDMTVNLNAESLFVWIEQYKHFFEFKKISRPMLAYLVTRIIVDASKNVQVEFLHEREYCFLNSAITAYRF